MPPLVASTFRHRGTVDSHGVAALLDDLARGFAARQVQFANSQQQILVTPREIVDILIELASTGGDHSLMIRLTWSNYPLSGHRQAVELPDDSRNAPLGRGKSGAGTELTPSPSPGVSQGATPGHGSGSRSGPGAIASSSGATDARPEPSLTAGSTALESGGGTRGQLLSARASQRRRDSGLIVEHDFRSRSLNDPDDVARSLHAIAGCFRNGTLLFAAGDAELLMSPGQDIDIAVDVRRRLRRNRVRLIMHWHHVEDEALSPGDLQISVPDGAPTEGRKV